MDYVVTVWKKRKRKRSTSTKHGAKCQILLCFSDKVKSRQWKEPNLSRQSTINNFIEIGFDLSSIPF